MSEEQIVLHLAYRYGSSVLGTLKCAAAEAAQGVKSQI